MAALSLLFLLLTAAVHDASSTGEPANSNHLLLPSSSNQRLTHIRFFWHDIAAGPNATAVIVAQSATRNATTTNFGSVRVMDDVLTVGPNLTSQLVGKSQGLYVSADKETTGLFMAMTFTFTVDYPNRSLFPSTSFHQLHLQTSLSNSSLYNRNRLTK